MPSHATAPPHFEHRLSNGLTILAEPTPTARSFACGLFVKTGTRDEPRDLNGVSHFLEHMMFKGSDARDAAEMNRVFDELGANYNAFTTQEMTAYYAAVLPEFAGPVMEHLGHLFRPALREADLETERKVILEEIAMYADDPGYRLFEEVMARHYGTHPLGMSVLGPSDIIAALPRDGMAAYHREHYGPRNSVLAVTGRFEFGEVVRLAEQQYGTWDPIGFEREYVEHSPAGGRTDLVDLKLNRHYLMGLCPGPAADDGRRFAARILGDVLGDGEGSRLYWALVDAAICDDADFGPYAHDRAGSFALSLTCDPNRGGGGVGDRPSGTPPGGGGPIGGGGGAGSEQDRRPSDHARRERRRPNAGDRRRVVLHGRLPPARRGIGRPVVRLEG